MDWVLDLHEVYGVDVGSGILAERPASWLTHRLIGLVTRQGTRLYARFYDDPS